MIRLTWWDVEKFLAPWWAAALNTRESILILNLLNVENRQLSKLREAVSLARIVCFRELFPSRQENFVFSGREYAKSRPCKGFLRCYTILLFILQILNYSTKQCKYDSSRWLHYFTRLPERFSAETSASFAPSLHREVFMRFHVLQRLQR